MSAAAHIARAKRHGLVAGDRYGRWTVLAFGRRVGSNAYYACQCDCGTKRDVCAWRLKTGVSKSCGCYCADKVRDRSTRHGHARKSGPSLTYRSWQAMHARCTKPATSYYHEYGGRGIVVCSAWDSFDAFLADMGERPSARHSLERRDVNGNYEPSNCLWATAIEQGNNRRNNPRIEHDGRSLTVTQWSRETGIPRAALWMRLFKYHWPASRALTCPVRK